MPVEVAATPEVKGLLEPDAGAGAGASEGKQDHK